FNFVHFHVYGEVLRDRRVQVLGVDGFEQTDFPIVAQCSVDPESGRVGLRVTYARADFTAQDAARFAAAYERVLQSLAADPDALVDGADLLDESEREDILQRFNARGPSLPEATLTSRFEARAAQTPDAVAVLKDVLALALV